MAVVSLFGRSRVLKGLKGFLSRIWAKIRWSNSEIIFPKFIRWIGWVLCDLYKRWKEGRKFDLFGVTCFVGRQGSGKTVSMVDALEDIRATFPDAKIITNFGYVHETQPMKSWRDIMELRNGEEGIVFAIDEIHSEWSANSWKDFPESLLSEISQQRKQKVKIFCTSQLYLRMVKPLREQCFEVVECRTLAGRWTFCTSYDAWEYEVFYALEPEKRDFKLKPLWKHSFIQNNVLRSLYDTYKKIERMKKTDFIPRHERGA